jgi:AcrR family transcriptional regulator
MAPRTKEQWEPIKARRRARILASALRLFATRGVETTSMDELARRSGVSKGLIYTYFKNKDALIGAVIDDGVETLGRLLPGEAEFRADPRRAVAAMVRSSFESMRSQKTFWSLYLSLLTHPVVIRRHRAGLMRAAEQFRQMVARGLSAAGREGADLSALTLLATLDGVMLHFLVAGDLYPLEELRDHILRDWLTRWEEA